MDSEGSQLDEQQLEVLARLAAVEARLDQLTQPAAPSPALPLPDDLLARLVRLEEALTLITDVNRYQRLQRLLQAGDLAAADEETVHVILQEAGESNRENLTPDAVKRFPCSVLQVIDRLWLKYTDGRFGFSVQLKLYQEVGGTLDNALSQDLGMLRKLGERLGWRENNQWKTIDQANYQMDDPVGCYPVVWWNSPYGAKMVNYFLIRLFTCEL